MDSQIEILLTDGSTLLLMGLAAATMFFAMAGLRELKNHCMEGLLYLTLALFFMCAHLLFFYNIPSDSLLASYAHLDFWRWLAVVLAPALIGLFIAVGLYRFICAEQTQALVGIFFGLTLLCLLYMLGSSWPADARGILVLIWSLFWIQTEVSPET